MMQSAMCWHSPALCYAMPSSHWVWLFMDTSLAYGIFRWQNKILNSQHTNGFPFHFNLNINIALIGCCEKRSTARRMLASTQLLVKVHQGFSAMQMSVIDDEPQLNSFSINLRFSFCLQTWRKKKLSDVISVFGPARIHVLLLQWSGNWFPQGATIKA